MEPARLFITIILDGVGIGEAPDAARYGDQGSDTLGHVCAYRTLDIANLTGLGLGRIRSLSGIEAVSEPRASYGMMREVSTGKDSTTGHWELAGLKLDRAFPTYPDGFPDELIEAFKATTGCGAVLGNKAASGTEIIAELGDEHVRTGHPIVYTSADSVFQIAAHVDIVPLDRLYDWCRRTRREVCTGAHGAGRVIARPFTGSPGSYKRISEARKDFSMLPTGPTVQEALAAHGVRTVPIGKIFDLFGGVGFEHSNKTRSNDDGVRILLEKIEQAEACDSTFIWINLVDFDQEFGHRNDPEGFAGALEAFDRALPSIIDAMPDGARLVITADHGNDPTTPSTDHSREYVPLLYYGSDQSDDLGLRPSFCDHAATVAAYFGVPFESGGAPFEDFAATKRIGG